MKTTIIISLTLLAITLPMKSQWSIEASQQKALTNYPMIKRYDLIKKTEAFNLSNANKGYLPQLSLAAKATYQSTVAEINVPLPGVAIDPLSKDQYSAELQLRQTIWDGGIIKNNKESATATALSTQRELDATLYQIQDRVNDLYFGVLLLDAQIKRNNLFGAELARNYERIQHHIQQGIANKTDLNIVAVEILNTKQNHTLLIANKTAFIEMLSQMVGEDIKLDATFVVPNYDNTLLSTRINRPELMLYDAKLKELDVQKNNIKIDLMPKFDLFATAGYGKPGLNMLENKFDTYWITGLRMAWNFGGLYTKNNTSKVIALQQEWIQVQRETFVFDTQLEMKQEYNMITKNRALLKHDDAIINLRTEIRKSAEIKLNNGTISTTDFMRDVTAEDMAKQMKIEHEMELLMSIYKHKFATNN